MPGRRIALEDRRKAIALYSEGYTVVSIAAQLGMTWNTVDRILRNAKVERSPEVPIKRQMDSYLGGPIHRCPECRHLVHGEKCRACHLRKVLARQKFPIEPPRYDDDDEVLPRRHDHHD